LQVGRMSTQIRTKHDDVLFSMKMLTVAGRFVRSTTGVKGRALNEMNNPRDVCLTTSNEWVVVSDSGNHRLLVFDINTFHVQRSIGDGNDSSVTLHFPFGICCDEHDLVYVCDRGNHRIVVIDIHRDRLVRQWGRKGVHIGEFDAPDFLSCRQNILAVSDFNNHRIQVFTLTGDVLFTFGKFGTGYAGEFQYPRGIAIDDEGFFMVIYRCVSYSTTNASMHTSC
jgi:DNA-binding beta-propeller fold protein YncE